MVGMCCRLFWYSLSSTSGYQSKTRDIFSVSGHSMVHWDTAVRVPATQFFFFHSTRVGFSSYLWVLLSSIRPVAELAPVRHSALHLYEVKFS